MDALTFGTPKLIKNLNASEAQSALGHSETQEVAANAAGMAAKAATREHIVARWRRPRRAALLRERVSGRLSRPRANLCQVCST